MIVDRGHIFLGHARDGVGRPIADLVKQLADDHATELERPQGQRLALHELFQTRPVEISDRLQHPLQD